MLWCRNGISFACKRPNVSCSKFHKQIVRCEQFVSTQSKVESESSDVELPCDKKKAKEKTKAYTPNLIPEEYVKAFSSGRKREFSVRISNVTAASYLADIATGIFEKDNLVLEFDAGVGLLSKALLQNEMKRITALEPVASFQPFLQAVKDEYQNSFNYFALPVNKFLSHSKEELKRKLPSTEIPSRDSHVQIIGCAASWPTLLDISRQFKHGDNPLSAMNLNLCICLPESAWLHFLDKRLPKACVAERIFFYLSFDCKILATLHKKDFFINLTVKQIAKSKLNDKMVVVQVKSKPQPEFDPNELRAFLSNFHNCASRNRLVIPSLEQWAPSCGEELVKRGMLVFTKFSDLEPQKLLEVFLYFRGLPSYEAFMTAFENVRE